MIIETNNKKFELGEAGCLRWILEHAKVFHVEQLENGNIRVFVTSAEEPIDVEYGAREIKPTCESCGKELD